jgi:hypothetical protein
MARSLRAAAAWFRAWSAIVRYPEFQYLQTANSVMSRQSGQKAAKGVVEN